MKVYFVGSGPGDPELLTLKGKRLLEEAEVLVYAGSLVDESLLQFSEGAELYSSASMSLEEMVGLMEDKVREGRKVVRLHSGDPSLYGAMVEQISLLEERGIECEVVPGVSSFLAAASLLKRQYTVPGGSQTLIITRASGRTEVPEKERLGLLARHGSSMAIFLSVGRIEDVVEGLREGYSTTTPVAVVYRATREGEKVIPGTLEDIAEKVEREGIRKTALILVGEFLERGGRSRLYSPGFSHTYRKG